MRTFRKISYSLIVILCANFGLILFTHQYAFANIKPVNIWLKITSAGILILFTIFICFKPQFAKRPNKQLSILSNGCELLRVFLVSISVTVIYQVVMLVYMIKVLRAAKEWTLSSTGMLTFWIVSLVWAVLVETMVFWGGMIRIYASSVQLGINHRVMAVILAWIPVFNIFYLLKMIHISEAEAELETNKIKFNINRAESQVCHTKYPLLLVHGVFFRDFRYFNYWGRIPSELAKNGATIFYGNQESAQSVEECGRQLAERIKDIVKETGCEKVNVIAHSKGGLDCRAAISHFGADKYVASLTTINTPHKGCIFAGYLLEKIPDHVRQKTAAAYNRTLKRFGDRNPDFLEAVFDLTADRCKKRNEMTKDVEGILYESVMSYCKKAKSGRFPLNLSYPLVKNFDGKNDGLVSVESAKWGSNFTVIEPKGKRGISHGDMIDLNRENFKGFDVREFYVGLVSSLKERGY